MNPLLLLASKFLTKSSDAEKLNNYEQ